MNEKESLKDVMRERLIGLLKKPVQEAKEKKPANKLWLAAIGFNGMMVVLDTISGITVGYLVNPMYGVLTFLAGFLALLLHENLFTNAHAGMHQKWIAIGGMVLAVISTFGIGVLAGIANVFNVGAMVSSRTLEIGMIISLVVISAAHGILWGVYFFTDAGHKAVMNRLINQAFREQQRQHLDDAKADVVEVKAIAKELDDMDDTTRELTELAYNQNTGRQLVNKPAFPAPIAVDPNKPFEIKQSTTETPKLGEPFRDGKS